MGVRRALGTEIAFGMALVVEVGLSLLAFLLWLMLILLIFEGVIGARAKWPLEVSGGVCSSGVAEDVKFGAF